jgi:hypothetical protein
MNANEAQVRVTSAQARHERLCKAKDRGEPVDFALTLAHADWVKAREQLALVVDASGGTK